MCGISGIVSNTVINNLEHRIKKMDDSLYHRGPDADGINIIDKGHIAFGHRRLAIIDLDRRSDQPFESKTGNSILVFNGEIYNYITLKNELNYDFGTNSDTEVLIAGLESYGIDWINKCNGMFAFAYYDKRNNRTVLCRDRMGIKPLYYYIDKSKLVFSSEIKGILNSGMVKAEFNYEAIDEYLGNRYIREPYTFFKDIYQIPAGSYLIIDGDLNCSMHKYWDLPKNFNNDSRYDEDEIYDMFKKELINAIELRMISDVNLGTYLSGGIDSSLITAIAALKSKEKLNTYTIGFDELNEYDFSKLVAEKYLTKHHIINLERRDYFEFWDYIIRYKDAPLGVPNEVPLAVMSKELKKEITVVLSGEGADELMGGYGRIFRSPFDFEYHGKDKNIDFYSYFMNKYEYVPRHIRDKYLKTDFPLRKKFDDIIKESFDKHGNYENVFRFFHKYHVKGLLQRVDTTTMYASVEARVPFLDHKLIEFSYDNIPLSLKLKWKSDKYITLAREKTAQEYSEIYDSPKYLLKRMASEYIPNVIINRKKMGFPVPLEKWFYELEKMAFNYLQDAEWINKDDIELLIKECRNISNGGQIIWMFINIERFRRMYFDKEWRYD